MPASPASTVRPGRSFIPVWWVAVLAALGLLALATAGRIARVDALTARPSWSVDAPPGGSASPTGHVHAQRMLIVPGQHAPSFWWIREAQQAAAEGRWRLRHVDYDAVSTGRDPGRTGPYRWWLTAVGRMHARLTGGSLGPGIERGALVADPLLLALLLAGGSAYAARYFGPLAGAGWALIGVALFPFAAGFQPGAPDPRSLAWVLAAAGLLPLLATAPRRSHFIAAGITGGLGFWNDAASHGLVLGAIGIGALAAELARSRHADEPPLPWRAWAGAGALTTLVATLAEFGPEHFTGSLRTVHPVHALAWWGLGEVLMAAGRWRSDGRAAVRGRMAAVLGAGLLALAAWPVAAFAGSGGGLLADDFHARELANHPRAGAASTLAAWLERADGGAASALLLSAGLLGVLGTRLYTGRTERPEWRALVLVVAGGLLVLGCACVQLRWWNLLDVFLLAGMARVWGGIRPDAAICRAGSLAAGLLVLPGLIVGFPARGAVEPTQAEAQTLLARDFAHALVRRSGAAPIVLYSTPALSDAAGFYGGFKVVTSTDGANRAGYETAMRIAGATTEQEAAVLLQSRGITHVALPSWDPVLDHFVRLALGLSGEQPLPREAFAVALRDWDVPLWMRPMDYLIPREPVFQDHELRVFTVGEEQEPDLALSRLADFFVERGQLAEARALRDSLAAYPRSVAAVAATAGIDFALRDGVRLAAGLEALKPMLRRRTARSLPPDRRISLAVLLLRTRQPELAREQLTLALAALDESGLRRCTPGLLVNLLGATQALGVALPQPEWEDLALELIPPVARPDRQRP